MLTLEPLDPVDELLVVAVRAVVDVLLELVGGLLHVPLESHAHVLVAEPDALPGVRGGRAARPVPCGPPSR
eukprot:925883-Pyramimonas_sp.AAC.1